MNVLHYSYSGGAPAVADLTAIGNKLGSGYGSALSVYLPTSTSLTTVTLTDLAAPTGNEAIVTMSHPGTGIGVALAGNTATVMSFLINVRYRGGHPRAYFPSMSQNWQADPQHWTSAAGGQFTTAMQAFLQGINGFQSGATTIGSQVAVAYFKGHTWSQDQHGNWKKIPTRLTPPIVNVISSYRTNLVVGSQRRRAHPG
jgi:hypothetical protein